ncbi:hypothetical protein [Streptomyces caeruleatus]|nr:hypothetical protein [Streptomyces caeruleatus]
MAELVACVAGVVLLLDLQGGEDVGDEHDNGVAEGGVRLPA